MIKHTCATMPYWCWIEQHDEGLANLFFKSAGILVSIEIEYCPYCAARLAGAEQITVKDAVQTGSAVGFPPT